MFSNLASRLADTFKRLRGMGKLTEADVDRALREVRLSLLEADVNFHVVRDFIKKVRERAVGQEVMASLTPGQQVVKIVYEELTRLMGSTKSGLNLSGNPPAVIMLVGLQGSGKTTTAAKLGLHLRKSGRSVMLAACDTYRPAAQDQLARVGEKAGIPTYGVGVAKDPVAIAREAVVEARRLGKDTLIVDTAGRLHVDEALMDELSRMKQAVNPKEVLLVCDAMTGQDAVNLAQAFSEQLGIDGVILTKLDGDARGGAALSLRAVTGRPVKYVGVGEKLEALEPFHPDRMAGRILGMGDVLTLIERAEETFNAEQARKMEQKLRKQQFTLEDFLEQLKHIKRMGPLDQILGMIPGFSGNRALSKVDVDPKELIRIEAIINSMTRQERENPAIINGSRRKRIAAGSGTRVQDVNRLLRQYGEITKMMKQLSSVEKNLKKGKFPFM